MKVVIHWFRRDLRITDNTALREASSQAEQVVPVYILAEWKKSHGWTGPNRQAFLCGSLEALRGNLEHIGGRLLFRQGDAVEELLKLAREAKAEAIFTNADPDPHGKATEERLKQAAEEEGIAVRIFHDHTLHGPEEVLTNAGRMFRVFTPYSRAWWPLPKAEPHGRLRKMGTPTKLASLDPPTLATWGLSDAAGIPEPGERAARDRMNAFLKGPIHRYGQDRNIPSGRTTSRLSQDLRHGLLSIRDLYHRCIAAREEAETATARKSVQTFINELAWREFYMGILHHYPNVLDDDFNPDYAEVTWDEPDDRFERWKAGETGFPIVDAAMRELARTGFMHNRPRMIVAMFLTKDLHFHWRLGEQYFMQQLVDGEIGSNNGGWQWSAGTGADAAPYFRIQNPWTQSERFDSKGEYIRQWIPELRDLPDKALHQPPNNGGSLAKGYPAPMLDHKTEREETLRRFKAGKK